jgi:hypothetical protein
MRYILSLFFLLFTFSGEFVLADFQGCPSHCASVAASKSKGRDARNKVLYNAYYDACMEDTKKEGRCGGAPAAAKTPSAAPVATGSCHPSATDQINGDGFNKLPCHCAPVGSNKGYEVNYGEACSASGPTTEATTKTDPAPTAVASPTNSDCPELVAFENQAKRCQEKGVDAVASCKPENAESNKDYAQIQSVVKAASKTAMAYGQQAGSAEACFNAGAIGTGSWQALDMLKKGCESEISTCESECGNADEQYRTVYLACINRKGESSPGIQEYSNELGTQLKSIKEDLNSGIKSCQVEAKSNEQRISQMMKEMNNTAQQAAKCQCQLTAGQTNCDQVQGPEFCAANPMHVNCPKVVTMKCAGADSQTKECICLRDPKSTQCVTGLNTGSQLAGAGAAFSEVATGNTNFKGSSGGGDGGLGSLDGLNDTASLALSSDKSLGGADSPFGVAGSGGGGSGAGGGSGGADGSGAGAEPGGEPEAKSGIGGLFNQLKTSVAGLFGGKGSAAKNSSGGKNYGSRNLNKGFDPNKYRPVGLRGIAGADGSGMGRKNMDIFKMVNNQYSNQYHTLMVSPR